ncbi:UPF0481 protein At3g47200-like [Corylus avellana]|uniref:UPF0481 protein At3g47200-like n=1 Tax=Corylus avellana TaxID=13451 RepID=UPI00286AF9D3|nr:UPF0481 protein At3g47200-like [Corylus avellana]
MASDFITIAKEAECEELVIDIPSDLPHAEWREYCIYRVPKQLRKVNEEAYTPKLLSIGPFHRGKDDLKDMEMHKLKYLENFLRRTKKSQADLLKIIKVNEVKIRHCYSEDCGLESDDFVKMILLDAIFIIELFVKDKEKKEEEEAKRKGENYCEKESDYILSHPWLGNGILHDLIILENQLPFFVLEELYRFALGDSSSCNNREQIKEDLKKEDSPFVELSRKYFRRYVQQQPLNVEEVKHFTDLLRYFFCPSKKHMEEWRNEESSNRQMEEWSSAERGLDTRFCATKLYDSGLKFKAVKDHSRVLLDISVSPGCVRHFSCFDAFPRFSCLIACLPCIICLICFPCLLRIQRILKVPQLVIDDDTETVFRNLMALEQCHYPSQTYICSYVLLLDRLVDTEKDVDLLIDKKVIINNIGCNAAVTTLINKLGDQIVEDKSCYYDLAKKLNQHYKYYPLNHILATLTKVYFGDFWRDTATIVGLVVLDFTFWNFLRFLVESI